MLTKTKARIVRAGIAAAVALAVFPAAASAKCETVVTSKVFAPLGDNNDYFLAPGGDFEGTLEWSTSGPVVQRWTHPALSVAGPDRPRDGHRRLRHVAQDLRGRAAPDAALRRLGLRAPAR